MRKSFLVTGAGGSIGSALCERLIRGGARRLILLSLTEAGLYNVERRLRALRRPDDPIADESGVIDGVASGARYDTEIVPVLGSVGDTALLRELCHSGIDTVIHTAAHKHVPICEANPIAAIENNVRGTMTLASEAMLAGIPEFLLVSSDKAVRPSSVMGATKRVAEILVDRMARTCPTTRFVTVRFGNVLDSAGSVLPLWREQIAAGGPLTLTDPGCERYFMSIPEACELIVGTLALEQPGTFVFDMGARQRLTDIAQRLIVSTGMPCDIKFIGLRPGEKLVEELALDGQLEPTSHPRIRRVKVAGDDEKYLLLTELLGASSCRNRTLAVELLKRMAA